MFFVISIVSKTIHIIEQNWALTFLSSPVILEYGKEGITKMKKIMKRFIVVDKIRNYYNHGEYSNKYYAIKVAEGLSKSLNVYVVDRLAHAVIWG